MTGSRQSTKKGGASEEYHKSLKQNVSIGRIADADGEDANESFICVNVGIYQIRKTEIRQQDESFCNENKNIQSSLESGV